jgi:hypothetical protein
VHAHDSLLLLLLLLLQVRAVFARHNLLDDFDSWSDISVWHKIRVPPTIFFYDGGAVVSNTNDRHHYITRSCHSNTTDTATVIAVGLFHGLKPAHAVVLLCCQNCSSCSIADLTATP